MMMDKYFESLTEYAGSVCGDSVSEDVAEEMRFQSEDSSDDLSVNTLLEPPPITLEDKTDLTGMTLVIGNTHRLVIRETGSPNKHLWTFYLLTSVPEIIKEVRVHLHESFTTPDVILKSPPYQITCIGWGYFSIAVQIVLKRGYLWREANARVLPLDWMLDFRSAGSSATHDYDVTAVSGQELKQEWFDRTSITLINVD